MERQTKHRILGILVIIGLVIILLPLFQTSGEINTNTAAITPPPFPDQPVQMAANAMTMDTTDTIQPQSIKPVADNNAPHPDDDIINTVRPEPVTQIAPVETPLPQAAAQVNQPTIETDSDADTVNVPVTHTDVVQSEMTVNQQKTSNTPAITNNEPEKVSKFKIIEGDKAATLLNQGIKNAKSSRQIKVVGLESHHAKLVMTKKASLATTTQHGSLREIDRLSKLNSAAWVIQVGSYKNKANALRIVNELRANGYRAFIQEISSIEGDHTRVYVGPENKRTNALALADRLNNHMHVQGIVISYQPLTL